MNGLKQHADAAQEDLWHPVLASVKDPQVPPLAASVSGRLNSLTPKVGHPLQAGLLWPSAMTIDHHLCFKRLPHYEIWEYC